MTQVTITQIPLLNSVVIKQKEGHFFISTSDSFIIDRVGLLMLIKELVVVGFLDKEDLQDMVEILTRKEKNENKKNVSDSGIG